MFENDIHIQNLLDRIHVGSYNRRRLFRLLFEAITFLISILFLGFLIVAPLDILAHAAKSHQFLEFFITIGGIVAVFVLNIYWFFYRYFTLKQILKYNPKLYIPIFTQSSTPNDEDGTTKDNYKFFLVHPKLYNLTLETFDLMPKLQYYFNYNKNKIVFNKGISPPKKSFDNFNSYNNYTHFNHTEVELDKKTKTIQDMLPFLTNYSSVIEAFSQDLKTYTLDGQSPQYWKMKIFSEMNLFDKTGLTYLEYLKVVSYECKKYEVNTYNFDFKRFIKLYNKLKFGNRTASLINVSESDFITFMNYVIDFYKIKQDLEEAKYKYNYLNNMGSSQIFSRNKESFLHEDMAFFAEANNSMTEGNGNHDYSKTYDSSSDDNTPMFDLRSNDDNDSDDFDMNNMGRLRLNPRKYDFE